MNKQPTKFYLVDEADQVVAENYSANYLLNLKRALLALPEELTERDKELLEKFDFKDKSWEGQLSLSETNKYPR